MQGVLSMAGGVDQEFEWKVGDYLKLERSLDKIKQDTKKIPEIVKIQEDHGQRIKAIEDEGKVKIEITQLHWWQNETLVKAVAYGLTAVASILLVLYGGVR